MSLVSELKRRSVFKVGAAYLVVAWLSIQAASIAFPTFEAPVWALRVFIFAVLIGFPVALVLAWAFEITPEGVKVDAAGVGSRRIFVGAAALLALAIAWYYLGQPAVRDDGPRSLAVLPFASLGGDAESSGLAGGLHDTLITQLSKIKGLEVRSRTSVMKYKDWNGGLKQVAAELGVSVLLEGSVQRIGNRTVVNAQLIDARTDAHIWADTFDRTSDDLFALQSEIAQRVTKALAVALSPAEQQALTVAPTQDTEAYALYVEAMRQMNDANNEPQASVSEAGLLKAAAIFDAAVAKDPQFALAWAMLARTYASITWNTRDLPYAEYAAKTRATAQRASALGPDLPEARFATGTVALQLDFDFPRAVRDLLAATQGLPGNSTAFNRLAQAQAYAGDFASATTSYEKALAIEPNGANFEGLGGMYIVTRRFDDARALARKAAALNAGAYGAARALPRVGLMANGDVPSFIAFVRSTSDGFRASPNAVADRWFVAIAEGDPAAALAELDGALEAARPDTFHVMRGDALRRLGRDAEAAKAYAIERDRMEKQLAAPRDPFIEAYTRTQLGYVQARLGDVAAARENAAAADRLWGVGRDPSDGAQIWFNIAVLMVAVGDAEAAVDKLTWLADNPSLYTAGAQWSDTRLASLHANPRFRALMQKHGIDVNNEPFADNRAAKKAGSAK